MRELRFGQFRLDPARRELRRGDELVALQPKAFDCVAYLAEHRDRAVGRDELIAAVWGRTEIGDNVLDQVMLRARRALGDTEGERRILRTVPRFGFAWIAPTEVVEVAEDASTRTALLDASPETVPQTNPEPVPLASAPIDNGTTPAARPRRFAIAALLLLLALAAGYAAWRALPVTAPAPTSAPNLALVLPVSIPADAKFAWARLGAMDLIADRLRTAGQPMLPSDNVVALARELSGDTPNAEQLQTLRDASAASTVFRAEAHRAGDAWRVTLQSIAGREPPLFAEGEAHELLEAAAAAADRMASELGLPPPQPLGDLVSPRERALHGLLQQVDAAMLADQTDTARALLDSLDASQRQLPEVRFRRAYVDFIDGRLDPAQAELEALRESESDQDVYFRGRVLNLLSNIAGRRDDYARAEQLSDNVIDLLGALPPSPELGRAWMGRAIARSALYRFDASVADFARARITLEGVGDRLGVARVDANVGILEARRDRFAEALPLLDAAADRLASFHDLNSELFVRVPAIYAHLAQLDPAATLALDARMAVLIEREPNPKWKHYAALSRVDALAANGHVREAHALLAQVREDAERADDGAMLGTANGIAARMALAEGDSDTALRHSGDVLANRWDAQHPRERGSVYLIRVRAQLAGGDTAGAVATASALSALTGNDALPVARLHAGLAQAAIATAEENHDAARSAFDAALAAAEATRVPADLLDACAPYAEWLIARGDPVQAGAIAARLAPWAGRDFDVAVLQARVHHALGQSGPWRAALNRAQALAGERAVPPELLSEP